MRIAFVSDRSGNYDVYSVLADGSDVRRLTTASNRDDYRAWSPDGRRIAFSRLHGSQMELHVTNADGSGQTRLTDTSQHNVMPAWSPDGRQITRVRAQGSYGALVVANADGGNMRTVVSGLRYLQHPVWSREGTWIDFDDDLDNDYWNELQVIKADGTGRRKLLDADAELAEVYMGAWPPNGSIILATLIV